MSTSTNNLPGIWMKLTDRKKLAKLMAIQGVSARRLSTIAGWESHTYLQRLLKGQVDTLKAEPALRIARHLGVGVDDLFMARLSTDASHSAKRSVA